MSTPPTTPYRTEIDALIERKATLEKDLARVREQATHLEALKAEEAELAKQIAALEGRLGGAQRRRALPMLDQVSVASPCNADWNEMVGSERVRFCLSCEKNVYNLSAMPQAEAEALLVATGDADTCIRFYRRADGTVMTADCPVGQSKKRRKMAALAIAGAASLAATALLAFRARDASSSCASLDRSHYVRDFQPQAPTDVRPVVGDPRPVGVMSAGGMRVPPPQERLMGKRAMPPRPDTKIEVKGERVRVK